MAVFPLIMVVSLGEWWSVRAIRWSSVRLLVVVLVGPVLLATGAAGTMVERDVTGVEDRLRAPDDDGLVSLIRFPVPPGVAFGVHVDWAIDADGPVLSVLGLGGSTRDVPLPPPMVATTGQSGCLRTYGIPNAVDFPWANDPPNWRGCNFQFIRSSIDETTAFCASNGESCFIEATAGHSNWAEPHRFMLRCWGNGAWLAHWATGTILNEQVCELTHWGDLPGSWSGYSSICATNYEATLGLSGCMHRGEPNPQAHPP